MLDFDICFKKLYPALCVYAFQYLKDGKLSEDVVQEAFLKLWDKFNHFDHFYKVKAFLYITIRNHVINLLEHEKIKDKYSSFVTSNKEETDSDFELSIISSETNRLLYQAINSLPPQTRRVIILSMEDITNQEIADVLNISIDTVKTLKKRAYKTLREKLSDNYWMMAVVFISLYL